MEVLSAFTLPLALLATACLPAVVAAAICADAVVDRLLRVGYQWRHAWRERRVINRLNQLAVANGIGQGIDLTQFDGERPSIGEIAEELRRLGALRLAVTGQSRALRQIITRAYDDRLRQACRCLGLSEHLDDLDGIDLEIERVRVEGELQAAGLVLPAAAGRIAGSGGEGSSR